MAEHNLTGQRGEQLAADYLLRQGYVILNRNYRYRRAEIDIIARQDRLLVFVEVKTRSGQGFGFPEASVGHKKISLVLAAADNYIYHTNWPHDVRFDIIAINTRGKTFQLHHIPDAFH